MSTWKRIMALWVATSIVAPLVVAAAGNRPARDWGGALGNNGAGQTGPQKGRRGRGGALGNSGAGQVSSQRRRLGRGGSLGKNGAGGPLGKNGAGRIGVQRRQGAGQTPLGGNADTQITRGRGRRRGGALGTNGAGRTGPRSALRGTRSPARRGRAGLRPSAGGARG